LPQQHDFAWDMPVRDMVGLGRYAFGSAPKSVHDAIVRAQIARCGIAALADRSVLRLSGGERALAALARVLTAETPVLLLDEPVAALDPARQFHIMDELAELARTGRTILGVFHDLGLVAQYADTILWMKDGAIQAQSDCSMRAMTQHITKIFDRAPQWADGPNARHLPYFVR
jgi:iron complex transport system ATP-binding protein